MARKAEERGAIAARRRAREEGWRKHLRAWRGSGLSQTEYCRRHGVTAADFSWWKCELARTRYWSHTQLHAQSPFNIFSNCPGGYRPWTPTTTANGNC